MAQEQESSDTRRMGKLLRGEIAAVESYERAIRDLGRVDGVLVEPLRGILEDHRQAVSILQGHVSRNEADPEQGSGGWGVFAKAVEKAGAALGERALLEALRQGETHGVSEYRTALDSGDLPSLLATDVRERLLPAQKRHVAVLDELMGGG